MASEHWESITVLIFGTIGIAVVFRWVPKVKQTTLVAILIWTAVSLASILLIEAFAVGSGRADSSGLLKALRFVAATSTLCPFVARLGAKRPQQRAWQFIVLTLWLVLTSPAAESLVLKPNQPLEVAGARSWFLALLILFGLFDRIPTRFASTALLAACGQSLLLMPYLPLPVAFEQLEHGYWMGVALLTVSLALESCGVPRRKAGISDMDLLWLDFRDNFGTLWGLRILERLNATAEMSGWDFRLTWSGFRRDGATVTECWPGAFYTGLTNLLRRFVGPDWIASRIGKHVDY